MHAYEFSREIVMLGDGNVSFLSCILCSFNSEIKKLDYVACLIIFLL